MSECCAPMKEEARVRSPRRSAGRWVAAVAVLVGGLGLVPGTAAVAAPAYPADALADAAPTPALSWSDCQGGFRCATAEVPLATTPPRRTWRSAASGRPVRCCRT